MLKFEININKIKSIYKNQIKNDENFIINYAIRINQFGSAVLSNFPSDNLLKKVCSVAECYLIMNSPNFETIKSVLQMGVKKVIIPEKEVKNIGQKISKKIIIARITLQKMSLLNNNLKNLTEELEEIINRVNPYCSELLIDYDDEINTDKSILLGILNIISSFNQNSITFLDPNSTITKELEMKGIIH